MRPSPSKSSRKTINKTPERREVKTPNRVKQATKGKSENNAQTIATPRRRTSEIKVIPVHKGKLKALPLRCVTALTSLVKPHECIKHALCALCALAYTEFNDKLPGNQCVAMELKDLKEYLGNTNKLQNALAALTEKEAIPALDSKNIANSARFAAGFRYHYTSDLLANEQTSVKEVIRFVQSIIKFYGEIKPMERLRTIPSEAPLPKTPQTKTATMNGTATPAAPLYTNPSEDLRCEPCCPSTIPQPQTLDKLQGPAAGVTPYVDVPRSGVMKHYQEEQKSEGNPVVIKAYLTNPENSHTDETGRSKGSFESPKVAEVHQLDFSFEQKMHHHPHYMHTPAVI
jgi:hypothetical protein